MFSENTRPSTVILAAFTCLLWSTTFVSAKIALQYVPPLLLAGMRFTLAGLLLLPFCLKPSRYWRALWANRGTVFLLGFIQAFLTHVFYFIGLDMVPGALAAIVLGSSPLFTSVVAHFFMPRDTMSRGKTIQLMIGMLGVVIISLSREPWSSAGFREFLGVLLLCAACITTAFASVLVARKTHEINPVVLNSFQLLIGGPMLLLLSLPFDRLPDRTPPPEFFVSLFWMALVSAAGFSIWFLLLHRPGIRVSHLEFWKFIIPVIGATIAWLILPDESPSFWPVVGMVCVAAAIAASNLPVKHPARIP
ncbi:MAG TPA: DMT family transporter [Spirochaetia bacterium]|nr:DMT family transporter [Spirochaetia bacterium]